MENQEQIAIHLFAGYLIDPPMQYELDRSSGWKQAQIAPASELRIVDRQGDKYIGIYINTPMISTEKLIAIEEEISNKLKGYFSKFRPDKNKLILFPQLLVY